MAMIDVGKKCVTRREAIAEGSIILKPSTIFAIKKKKIAKGDVLEAAKIAGILAVKKTPSLIPLCHPIPIEYADIEFSFQKQKIKIRATVKGEAKTGMEIEAIMAVSIAALTIYDMCKPLDKGITISEIKLVKKTGGRSGTYERK